MKMNRPIRILLVDDHFVVRTGLAASINEEPDLDVVCEAADMAEARALLARAAPDMGIIDMHLQDGHGAELIRELGIPCLALSVSLAENDIRQAVEAGARGYISKTADRTELIEAVRCVGSGERYFPAGIARVLETASARPGLTPRETDVLELIVRGSLNKEIAEHLGMAEATVKQHVSAVLRKLDVQDRTQAAIAAVERGIVRL